MKEGKKQLTTIVGCLKNDSRLKLLMFCISSTRSNCKLNWNRLYIDYVIMIW
jgi:hypothetical protein